MHPIQAGTLGLGLFLSVGCSMASSESGDDGVMEPVSTLAGVPFTVQNGTSQSVRIFILEGGEETALGRVAALGTLELRLREDFIGMVNFLARTSSFDTDRGHRSEPILISPGHRLTWQLRTSPGSNGPRFSTLRSLPCSEDEC